MKVRSKKTKGVSIENRILEACVMSTEFVRGYAHIHRPDLFKIPFGAWLATRCILFFKEYGEAPKKNIIKVVNREVKLSTGKMDVDVMRDFLRSIEYATVEASYNAPYLIASAETYFNLQSYHKLKLQLESALERDDVKECEKALVETKRVRVLTGQIVDLQDSKDKLIEAFEQDEKPLFRLPGHLGRMFNSQFKRQRFIAFLAIAKAGKTWVIYKLALVAKMSGLNVAVFAAGDEDEASSLIRLSILLTHKNNDPDFCGPMFAPVMDCVWNQNGTCSKRFRTCQTTASVLPSSEDKQFLTPEILLDSAPSSYVPCTHCRHSKKHPEYFQPAVWYAKEEVEEMGWREAWRSFRKLNSLNRKSRLKLFTYPNDTLTVTEMERVLDVMEDQYGWVPDVVIVDYPDIMRDDGQDKEFRHKENGKWKSLRRFNQERNNLLITVTQSNRVGYKVKSMGADSVNEDRRKLDHVTALYAINQSEQEKALHMLRMGPIVQRKGRFETSYQMCVLQSLEKGSPFKDSFFVRVLPEDTSGDV